ncbi:hypothetical protein ATR1_238c0001, partial [Acetobacter tropicalis]
MYNPSVRFPRQKTEKPRSGETALSVLPDMSEHGGRANH